MATGAKLKSVKKNKGGIEGLIKRSESAAIKVGILKGTGNHPNSPDTSIAEIFAQNEFGVPEKNIPERPVLRVVFRIDRAKYRNLLKRILQKITKGSLTLKQGRGILGEAAQSGVQDYIRDLKSPPNSPVTIERKKSSNPLIDTGVMRQSVRWGPENARVLRRRTRRGITLRS